MLELNWIAQQEWTNFTPGLTKSKHRLSSVLFEVHAPAEKFFFKGRHNQSPTVVVHLPRGLPNCVLSLLFCLICKSILYGQMICYTTLWCQNKEFESKQVPKKLLTLLKEIISCDARENNSCVYCEQSWHWRDILFRWCLIVLSIFVLVTFI